RYGRTESRLPAARGDVPSVQRIRDRREPRRRPHVLLLRPAREGRLMQPTLPTTEPPDAPTGEHIEGRAAGPKSVARLRRRAALKRTWAQYRRNKMGMAGLITLILMGAIAIFAPLIVSSCNLNPTCPSTGAHLQPPSLHYPFWFGSDNLGRPVLTLTIFG